VRAGLRGEYVNSALVWVRLGGVLLTVITLEAAIDPHRAGTPRWAAIPLASVAALFRWSSLHYRVGPQLGRADVRRWLRLVWEAGQR
jgi:hypothetical protein